MRHAAAAIAAARPTAVEKCLRNTPTRVVKSAAAGRKQLTGAVVGSGQAVPRTAAPTYAVCRAREHEQRGRLRKNMEVISLIDGE